MLVLWSLHLSYVSHKELVFLIKDQLLNSQIFLLHVLQKSIFAVAKKRLQDKVTQSETTVESQSGEVGVRHRLISDPISACTSCGFSP